MAELLKSDTYFTSQELFVIFHIAYRAGFGIEVLTLDNVIIYWEPHHWKREIVREFSYWLGSENIEGYILSIVRNSYTFVGSRMRGNSSLNLYHSTSAMFQYYTPRKRFKQWKEQIIKFEDLKCNPGEILSKLCEWLGIPFDDILLETTRHGEKAFYDDNITGFDIKPAYNLYEEYFSAFDRMRICMVAGSYQKQYGYSYVSCLTFTRRELQEMFLKDFRWFSLLKSEEKNMESIWHIQNRVRYVLWLERFSEVLKIEISEEF